jgi:hypothetical protein
MGFIICWKILDQLSLLEIKEGFCSVNWNMSVLQCTTNNKIIATYKGCAGPIRRVMDWMILFIHIARDYGQYSAIADLRSSPLHTH